MRTLKTTLAALGLAALLTVPALAQGPGGRGGFGGPGGMMGGGAALLDNPSVQKELNLDSAQIEKADKLVEENRAKMREQFQGFQDLSQEERAKKMREFNQTNGPATQKAVAEILKPEQLKRFREIQLQQAGPAGFNNPHVQKALNLTDDQMTKIRDIERTSMAETREIFQNASGDREAAREKLQAHRKATMDKVLGVLGDEQKKTYHHLLGTPFEVKYERRGQ